MIIKFDTIGKQYNTTRRADPFLTQQLFSLLSPTPHKKYLDIGCGTGNYTMAIHHKGVELIGVDPSLKMLEKARSTPSNIEWLQGSSEAIPLANNSVDGCIATLTLHHWTDIKHGFKELRRVVRKGGKIVIFTSTPDQMKGYWLNHYFPKMLLDSMQQMPSLESLLDAMADSINLVETIPYFVQPDLIDHFLYCGKQHPKFYLDENIRQGISSFSDLAHLSEVLEGLKQLEIDIKNGTIDEVMHSFENQMGDYLFLVGEVL